MLSAYAYSVYVSASVCSHSFSFSLSHTLPPPLCLSLSHLPVCLSVFLLTLCVYLSTHTLCQGGFGGRKSHKGIRTACMRAGRKRWKIVQGRVCSVHPHVPPVTVYYCVDKRKNMCVRVCERECVYTYTRARTHTHTRKHIYMHIYTHKHTNTTPPPPHTPQQRTRLAGSTGFPKKVPAPDKKGANGRRNCRD